MRSSAWLTIEIATVHLKVQMRIRRVNYSLSYQDLAPLIWYFSTIIWHEINESRYVEFQKNKREIIFRKMRLQHIIKYDNAELWIYYDIVQKAFFFIYFSSVKIVI